MAEPHLTVGQLIERLKQMPQDCPVVRDSDYVDLLVLHVEPYEFTPLDGDPVQAVRLW